MSSPSGVCGGAPAEIELGAFWASNLTSGSNNFSDFHAHLHVIFHRMVIENVCLDV